MNHRQIGLLGIGAWFEFWCASIFFGGLRPLYSHRVNTISELGAIGTPNATLWNVFGFIVPGILLAVVGATIARSANPKPSLSRAFATSLLFVSGLAVAGQGLMPAAMANGVADITSPSTRGHFISSLVSGAAWTLGALVLVGPMKRNPHWRGLYVVSILLLGLTIATPFVLRGHVPDGLTQRIGDAFFCVWFVLMAQRLVTDRQDSARVVDHGSTRA